jgi:predicted HAD superfamily Cof-like phosphohydrolase
MEDLAKPPETVECGWYEMVRDFHKAFGHPAPDNMHPILPDERKRWATWMIEEVMEFVMSNDPTEHVDALIDLIIFALGVFVAMGVDPHEMFDAVHWSNMGKLGPDGKPNYDPYSHKLIKPATWVSPKHEISRILKARWKAEEKESDIPF